MLRCGVESAAKEGGKKQKHIFGVFLELVIKILIFFFFFVCTSVLVRTSILGSSLPFPGMNARVLLEIDFGAGGRGFYR